MLLQKSKKFLIKPRLNVEISIRAQDTYAFNLFHSILCSSVVCAWVCAHEYLCV